MRFTTLGRFVLAVALAGGVTAVSGAGSAQAISGQFDVVGPTGSGNFGSQVLVLSNGNVVVTDPSWDLDGSTADVGAVYLYDGVTHQVISTLHGTHAGDQVGSGGVTVLSNGNYVVRSPNWDSAGAILNVGAVTWGNATTGTSGVVSVANSLTGSTAGDGVGSSGVTALSNGNYVVSSGGWDSAGAIVDVGAATGGNGTTGTTGEVTVANSLTGTTANDCVGFEVVALANGNYVVSSPFWDAADTTSNVGALTWGDGSTGISGVVTGANSLTGSTTGDDVGYFGVVALLNGNYVVASQYWDAADTTVDVGAVTWGDGTIGISGVVSVANSLTGSTAWDQVGGGGVTALSNGNYVVKSTYWDAADTTVDVGAVTWGDGTIGISGVVSVANSLTGSTSNDYVGYFGVTVLSNGNYVVNSSMWDSAGAIANAGAATWGNGTTGTSGVVSVANSLTGTTAGDCVGFYVVALSNGNYVVGSPFWNAAGGTANAGAVTWGDGTTGTTGEVTVANSLTGSTTNDYVGGGIFFEGVEVFALSNGNYVVASTSWDAADTTVDVGAVTWGDGTTGTSGVVAVGNSLTGSTAYARVGDVAVLANGNYVVNSPGWDAADATSNVGAVTWVDGTIGISGVVTGANSLTGSTAYDQVGGGGVAVLSNGNYVVNSPDWDAADATVDVGAVTWGDGSSSGHRLVGSVSSDNSVTGTAAGQGGSLRSGFDYVNHQLVVGRPGDNIVTWATIPVAPRPPTIVSITPGSNSLTVVFTPGDNGGAPIDYYEYSTDGGSTWQRTTPDTTSSPYLITGLTNNTTYAIRIRAHNAVGSSHASHSVSATPFSPVIPATGTNTPGAIAIALMTLLAGAGAVLVAARNRTHIRR